MNKHEVELRLRKELGEEIRIIPKPGKISYTENDYLAIKEYIKKLDEKYFEVKE